MDRTKRVTGYVKGWERGQRITADRLNHMARNINANSLAISGPKQQNALDESQVSEGSGLSDLDFSETARTETTVQITDSNGDTFSIAQIDSITFQNSSGDILTLAFDNP